MLSDLLATFLGFGLKQKMFQHVGLYISSQNREEKLNKKESLEMVVIEVRLVTIPRTI